MKPISCSQVHKSYYYIACVMNEHTTMLSRPKLKQLNFASKWSTNFKKKHKCSTLKVKINK